MAHKQCGADRIYIKDLLLRCIVGINKEEREKKQDVIINIELHADLAEAGKSDSIDDTVNYKTLKDNVVTLVESSSFFLIEKMAEEIVAVCLTYEGVEAAKVLVEKPGALRFARTVGVEIFRARDC